MHHKPSPAFMDRYLGWVAERFTFTTLDVVVDALHSGDWSAVPERAIVLTLDDGDRGNYELLPVFRRHGVRPMIYLCSGVVGRSRRFWFESVADAEPYKRMRNTRRLETLKRELGFEQEAEVSEAERQGLSRDEILEMAPWVDFGAHTRFHPILTQCSDEEAWYEVVESKRELEALLDRPIRHFCYPNGDYLDREVEYARRAGFASARTVDVGWTAPSGDPFRLKILGTGDDVSLDVYAGQFTGIPAFLRRALHGRFDGSSPTILPAPE